MNLLPLSVESEDEYHFPLFPQHNDHFSQPQNCLNFFSGDVDQEANQNQKQKYSSQSFSPQRNDKQIVNFIEQVGRYLEPEHKNYNKESRDDKVNRYLMKKHKRVWGKKISYVCRQNVAKERYREKGRFVGRKHLSETKRQRANSTLSIEIPGTNQI